MNPHRIFLLSPAHCGGKRAGLIFNEAACFALAQRLRQPQGVPIGEAFSFLSGLYFRGKLAYSRAFANPSPGTDGASGSHDGADPRGATGAVGGPPANTPGTVGTMPCGTANALRSPGGRKGSATPAVVHAADGAAVVSGTLPRGATGTACGGVPSGPGELGAGR